MKKTTTKLAPNNNTSIRVERLNKTFKLPRDRHSSLKSRFVNIFQKQQFEKQKVLQNISFEVKKGEFFGVIGRNGSGKSTLLKILAGIYVPNRGNVEVKGSLTPFIELGVGFNPELTGRENVFLNGALLGFNRKEMSDMYNDIVQFAGIEKFMDQKLKNYSSGMQVRLAFSIAIRADTDILLIDEVLAVGDALFQQKCYDYFDSIKKSDKTVIFISHDMAAIQSFCDRAILIDKSKLILEGRPVEVTQRYSRLLADSEKKKKYESSKLQHEGVGGAEVLRAELINSRGRVSDRINEGEEFSIRIHYKTTKNIDEPVMGIGIMGEKGQSIIGPNTKESNYDLGKLAKRGFVEAKFSSNPLAPGSYRIRSGIFNVSVTIPYDFVEHLSTFMVIGKKRYGDIYVAPEWSKG